MATYLQHFNLTHAPLSKGAPLCFESDNVRELRTRFKWSLESPGICLLTGDPGVGKTAALHTLCSSLNTHEYQVIYHSDTDFGRTDVYRQLALDFGLEPAYRRASMWRALKMHVQMLAQTQHRLPVWIIDEAQNLPLEFFKDFPSFLNFAFDSQPLMTVWLVGHSSLERTLKSNTYEALRSRIQLFLHFEPLTRAETFKDMLNSAFKAAGITHTIISESGIDLIRLASGGKYRMAGKIIQEALQVASQQNLNHLPDEIIKQSIEVLQK
jgi:type II secretory pathway predicted ATPase ExeA